MFNLIIQIFETNDMHINFFTIRDSYYFFCWFIDYSCIDIPEKRRIQNTLVQKLMENN